MIEWLLKTFSKERYDKLINEKENELNQLNQDIENARIELNKLRNNTVGFKDFLTKGWEKENQELLNKKSALLQSIYKLEKELENTKDNILYSEVAFNHKPVVQTTIEYEDKLRDVKEKQSYLVKSNKAAIIYSQISFNNSQKEGERIQKQNIKFLLRAFNNESDNIVKKLKSSTLESSLKKLEKTFVDLNKLNEVNYVRITDEFFKLKLKEIQLVHYLHLAKDEEKELAKALREEERERKKIESEIREKEREIEKQRKEALREKQRLEKELMMNAHNQQLMNELKRLQDSLELMDKKEKELKDYAEKGRSGYVYIISNQGAFGENVYKIGMTRRLEPLERIKELSGASVPFVFDIHAMILTDDAPKLENKFHKEFDDLRVNKMNNRKEFFEINDFNRLKKFILKHEPHAVINEDVEAFEYKESLKLRDSYK